jgi:alanine racemase
MSTISTRAARPAAVAPGTVSWLEIDLAALRGNVRSFRSRLGPDTRLAAVVKADAYGHCAAIVAPAALEAGAAWLAVWGLGEGIALRAAVGPQVPVLLLGHVPPGDFDAAVEHDLRITLYDPHAVPLLAEAARRAGRHTHVHLKVETGTHRQGLDPAEVLDLARAVADAPGLALEGLSTHFADIEDTTDHGFAEVQRATFAATAAALEGAGLLPPVRHTACSAAAILFPETHLEMARAGIGLYGLWPSRETLVSARERGIANFALEPVMTWKCLIAQVKDVRPGGWVGYGRTWRASRPTRIAVLPVGYYEGYPRAVSGRAHVLVHGRRAPVVGRVCMNMMMVDVTDIPDVASGDAAVLLGHAGEEKIRAEDLANWAGTIHYEIVSRIHPSLPRVAV